MIRIVLDLPEGIPNIMGGSPEEFGAKLRLAAALYWYASGQISQEKAAQLAGLDRIEFILAASREQINIFQIDRDKLGDTNSPAIERTPEEQERINTVIAEMLEERERRPPLGDLKIKDLINEGRRC